MDTNATQSWHERVVEALSRLREHLRTVFNPSIVPDLRAQNAAKDRELERITTTVETFVSEVMAAHVTPPDPPPPTDDPTDGDTGDTEDGDGDGDEGSDQSDAGDTTDGSDAGDGAGV